MTPQRLSQLSRTVALILFWPAVVLVVWGELTPDNGVEHHVWDKLLHFTAYFGLAAIAYLALGGRRRALWAALGLILLGGALEIVQGMVGRDMSLWDEVANTFGAVSGAAAGYLYLARLQVRRLVGAHPPD